MKRVTKILVPVDFSDCSKNALTFAIQLADKIKASILVLNVSTYNRGIGGNPVSITMDVQERMKQVREDLNEVVNTVTEKIQDKLDEDPMIDTNIEMGKVKSNILHQVTKNQIDYIIMGTKGVTSTLSHYLGSVASHIVQDAPCPVMVIPKKAKFDNKIEMGYATNFSDADPYEIWKAVKLFKPFQPKIKIAHFSENQTDSQHNIKELKTYFSETAPELNLDFFSLPVKNKVEYMNDFIKNQNINMLVMYQPKRGFFDSLIHRSYTREMSMYCHTPLLVLKEKK